MTARTYMTVPGFFVQDDVKQSYTEEAILPRFGLIDEGTDRWTTFVTEIEKLNATAEEGVQFKVFFLGRHGQGYRAFSFDTLGDVWLILTRDNVAETKYGTKAWCEHWAKLNGDHEMIWGPDPQLTSLGEQQAEEACAAWDEERRFGIPLPEKLYISPLTRAIRTHQVTFKFHNIPLPSGPKRIIVENMREHNGVHTCDKRRTRSDIQAAFPEYHFEEGFTQGDELWTTDYRETHDDIDRRAKHVLDMIFQNDKEQFISFTAHGGFIGGFLRTCHHRPWILPTGGILPVVVRGSIVEGQLRN
ncbi:phosphoglycerate mutase-like protein [Imleria badia]|nr:phosphoglycerate mutase-like protein [Imleria badia]